MLWWKPLKGLKSSVGVALGFEGWRRRKGLKVMAADRFAAMETASRLSSRCTKRQKSVLVFVLCGLAGACKREGGECVCVKRKFGVEHRREGLYYNHNFV